MPEKMVAPELFRPLVDFPDVPYDHLVRAAAERTPDRPAIIYHDLILTYREVVSMINSIANGLHDLGLKKGDRICLFTTNRPEYIVTFIAAASIGVVVSPMNPGYKEREVSYQLENSETSAILVQRELTPVLQLVLSQKELPHLKHILVTGATGLIYLSYFLGGLALLRARLKGWPRTKAPFSLGKWGILVSVVGLIYGGAMLVNFLWPATSDSSLRVFSNPKATQTGGFVNFHIGFLNDIPVIELVMAVVVIIGAIYYLSVQRNKEYNVVVPPDQGEEVAAV